jgi:hypothetical protein
MSGRKYTYWDACRNVYTVQVNSESGEATLSYDPVTPEQSSSLHYSGGQAVQRTLPKSMADRFVQQFDQCKAAAAAAAGKPPSLTFYCQFTSEDAGGQLLSDFGVSSSDPNVTAWDQFLKTLKQQ